MRVKRSIPQKPLTEDQKQRALEAQKRLKEIQGPLTSNQLMQNSQSPLPQTRYQDRFERQRSFDRRLTFEEKYGVYDNQMKNGQVEDVKPVLQEEDLTVPPSLEENPDQGSPLPPDVVNASDVDGLDEYIKKTTLEQENTVELQKESVPIVLQQEPELGAETLRIMEENLKNMTVKELKQEYKDKGGDRDVSYLNNKKALVDLIINLVINGTQQEETTEGRQDGSVD